MATLFTVLVGVGSIGLLALITLLAYHFNLPVTGDTTLADLRSSAAGNLSESKKQQRLNRRTLFTFFLMFTGFGMMALNAGIQRMRDVKARKTWLTVEGTIVSSAEISYEYTVNDHHYTGYQVNFSGSTPTQEIIERYPEGRQVQVYYDPHDPGRAVLEMDVQGGSWLFLSVGAACAMVGLGAGLLVINPKLTRHS